MTRREYQTPCPPHEATKTEASDPKTGTIEHGAGGPELETSVEYTGDGTKVPVFVYPGKESESA